MAIMKYNGSCGPVYYLLTRRWRRILYKHLQKTELWRKMEFCRAAYYPITRRGRRQFYMHLQENDLSIRENNNTNVSG